MIKQKVKDAIAAGEQIKVTEINGIAGVILPDYDNFIPWEDLGYNEGAGFFQRSAFPDVVSNPGINYKVIKVLIQDSENSYWGNWTIIPDDHTDYFHVGDAGALANLYHRIGQILHGIVEAEQVSEDMFDDYFRSL